MTSQSLISSQFKNGISLLHRPQTWDRGIIEEVLADSYKIKKIGLPFDSPLIVDIGAHIGAFSAFCHYLWPNANIIAVEPEPLNYEILEKNLTLNTRANYCLPIHAAAGNPDLSAGQAFVFRQRMGTASAPRPSEDPFVWGPNTGGSFISRGPVNIDEVPPEFELVKAVSIWSLDKIVKHYFDHGEDIDLLKIDAEGAEGEILEYANWPLEKINFIVGECHSFPNREKISELLDKTHDITFAKKTELSEFFAYRK